MNKSKEIEKFWSKESGDYDSHMEKTKHYSAQMNVVDCLKDFIKSPVLDLAVGPGFLADYLFKKSLKVYGNDFSKKMINLAQIKNSKINFTQENAEELKSYLKNTFDTIISCNLFFYLQNRDKAIKRWEELLKSKGKIVMIEEYPLHFPEDGTLNGLNAIIDPISPTEISNIFKKHGFSMIKNIKVPIDRKHDLYGLVFGVKEDN